MPIFTLYVKLLFLAAELPDNDPVEVEQGEVALDMEDDVFADADLPVAWSDVDVTVEWCVGGIGGRFRVGAALLCVAVVRHLVEETTEI